MRTHIPADQIVSQLGEHIGAQVRPVRETRVDDGDRDLVLTDGKTTFLVEFKSVSTTDAVGSALHQLQMYAAGKEKIVPLLVVPFMGAVGREMCKRASVNWMDLSGNAQISTPNLRVVIEGKQNRFTVRGRPSDPFAPKSSRIARLMLLDPEKAFTQSEIVSQTGLDKGFVSRIVHRLVSAGLVQRSTSGTLHLENPAGLLGAWYAAYDFGKHNIVRGVVAARSGPELLQRLHARASSIEVPYALTGLTAAWLYAPFAAYRTVTLYVRSHFEREVIKELGIHETLAGSNVWVVFPNDDGVFLGLEERERFPCVSPLQTYLDLKGQPERAEEAADELRRKYLPWATS
jgi:hypothetical protein